MSGLRFLNVDLELQGAFNLRPLVDALSGVGLFLLSDEALANGFAARELEYQPDTPEEGIKSLLVAIDKLPAAATRDLRRCHRVVFNVGFDSGAAARPLAHIFESRSLQAVADLAAAIEITIYPVPNSAKQS